MTRARTWGITLGFLLLFILHQDVWWWDSAQQVGGLPIGLTYHLGYCGIVSLFLLAITRGEDRSA